MHNVPHVVVTVDVGVPQNAVQVLVDGFDNDVWVTGKDGDEGPFGEEHPYLQDNQQECDHNQIAEILLATKEFSHSNLKLIILLLTRFQPLLCHRRV